MLHAQEIHIRVLNARKGKPITDECLNVWVSRQQRWALPAPTNNEGVAVLRVGRDRVSADAVPSAACRGTAATAPNSVPFIGDGITVSGGNYIVCQEYGRVSPGGPVVNPLDLMPSYPMKRILTSGVSAANTCGKFRAQAKPGELVIFERSPTFWERMME
jgi:hypothetical protein